MTNRKTIAEVLPNGVLAVMSETKPDLVNSLFSEEQARDFDFGFLGLQGARYVSCLLDGKEEQEVKLACQYVLNKYYDSWAREKSALEAEYDVLENSGSVKTITETTTEKGVNTDTEKTQENMNAFDGQESSDTQGSERSGNREHDITKTFDRTEKTTGDKGVTKQSLIVSEMALRIKYKFFDIVTQDITRELCALVY